MLSNNLRAFDCKSCLGNASLGRLQLLGLCWALAILSMAGCGDNPGRWPMEKLSEHVKQSLVDQGVEVTEVNLTEKAPGVFEGTGQVAGGETLKLLVTQDPAAHRLTWDAEGDRGSFLDGSYELK